MANAKKPSCPILKVVLPSPWLKKIVSGIEYWVHTPSRKGGIHIRGLAKLCGVKENAIRSAIRNAKKEESNLRKNYATSLHNLLKNRDIFLDDLRKNSEIKRRGGSMKIICSDVCADFITYYAKKGEHEAIESLALFVRFGIEQFIYIQVGFIPRPESIMLADIEYLIAKETVQVNKSRQEEVRFFTNPVTGECGIALLGLSFLCGGVAIKHIETFLQAQNEPFLQPDHPEQIVKAPVCAKVLHYFGHEHSPRKTLAQHWATALDPIVPTLHKKTNYQAPPQTDREVQLTNRLQELELEIVRLRQLAKLDQDLGPANWHRLMARVLEGALREPFWQVLFELEMTKTPQYLDALIIKRPTPLPQDMQLPDGLRADVETGLLTYKSHRESLNVWSMRELIHHYVGFSKDQAAQTQDGTRPDDGQIQLYAVTTLYPQALVAEMGAAWQPTGHSGVYHLFALGLKVIVIVTAQIPAAPHNRPWNLLSNNPDIIRYALAQQALPPDLQRYFAALVAE